MIELSTRAKYALIGLSVVLVATGSGRAFSSLTRTTAVTVERAVEDFRREASRTTPPSPQGGLDTPHETGGAVFSQQPQAPGLPSDGPREAERKQAIPRKGVYVYRTDGYEQTDAATGSRHVYPEQTTIRLNESPCGFTARWDVLRERWEEVRYCVESDGHSFDRFVTYHEFFGKGDTQALACPSGSFTYRHPPHGGRSWTFTCTAPDSSAKSSAEEIAVETVIVDGQEVECVRVVHRLELTGRNRGSQKQERWLSTETGLLVRMTSEADMQTDSVFGTVRYEERYSLELASLTPLE